MKKIFRTLHLWLSVPFGLLVSLICFSGAMLVFENEITEWSRPDLYQVKEIKAEPLPVEMLLERVAETLPDSVSVAGVRAHVAGKSFQTAPCISLYRPLYG